MSPSHPDARDSEGNTLLTAFTAMLPMRPAVHGSPATRTANARNAECKAVVDELLALGAAPNQRGTTMDHRATPLMFCAKSWHFAGVHALLSASADPNLCDQNGFTALMVACTHRDEPGSFLACSMSFCCQQLRGNKTPTQTPGQRPVTHGQSTRCASLNYQSLLRISVFGARLAQVPKKTTTALLLKLCAHCSRVVRRLGRQTIRVSRPCTSPRPGGCTLSLIS
jgi:hypothetical protein